MPIACLAPHCTERSNPSHCYENKVHFHTFPNREKSPDRFAQWIAFCGKKGYELSCNSRICSKHFKESDYDSSHLVRQRLMPDEEFKPRLKSGAVPVSSSKNETSPSDQYQVIPEEIVFMEVEDGLMSMANDLLEVTSCDLKTGAVKVKEEFTLDCEEDEKGCVGKTGTFRVKKEFTPEIEENESVYAGKTGPVKVKKEFILDSEEDEKGCVSKTGTVIVKKQFTLDSEEDESGCAGKTGMFKVKKEFTPESEENDSVCAGKTGPVKVKKEFSLDSEEDESGCAGKSFLFADFAECPVREIKTEKFNAVLEVGASANEYVTEGANSCHGYLIPKFSRSPRRDIKTENVMLEMGMSANECGMKSANSSSCDSEDDHILNFAGSEKRVIKTESVSMESEQIVIVDECTTKSSNTSSSFGNGVIPPKEEDLGEDEAQQVLVDNYLEVSEIQENSSLHCGKLFPTLSLTEEAATDSVFAASSSADLELKTDCRRQVNNWEADLDADSIERPLSNLSDSTPEPSQRLKPNLSVHSNENSFSCMDCGKTFKWHYTLKRHAALHLNPKPFLCSLCPTTFSTYQELKRHSAGHSDPMRFSCSLCPARFKLHYNLVLHSAVHSGDRPFSCSLCTARFKRKQQLKGHFCRRSLHEKRSKRSL